MLDVSIEKAVIKLRKRVVKYMPHFHDDSCFVHFINLVADELESNFKRCDEVVAKVKEGEEGIFHFGNESSVIINRKKDK